MSQIFHPHQLCQLWLQQSAHFLNQRGLGTHVPGPNRNLPMIWKWIITKQHTKERHLSTLASSQNQRDRLKCQQVRLTRWCLGSLELKFQSVQYSVMWLRIELVWVQKEKTGGSCTQIDIWRSFQWFWELHSNKRTKWSWQCDHSQKTNEAIEKVHKI